MPRPGFKIVFNGKDDDDQPLVTALKETQWIQISYVHVQRVQRLCVRALKVPAELAGYLGGAWRRKCSKNGRVTLTGLNFDKDKAECRRMPRRSSAEVAALLVRQPDWKIRVEAHSGEAADKPRTRLLSQSGPRRSRHGCWIMESTSHDCPIQGLGDAEAPSAD